MSKKVKLPNNEIPEINMLSNNDVYADGGKTLQCSVYDHASKGEIVHINGLWFKEILDECDWDNISENKELITENFCEVFSDKVNWHRVTKTKVEEQNSLENKDYSFFKIFKKEVDWDYITRNLDMTVEFMKNMHDYINWDIISKEINLDIYSMNEFKEYLNWDLISHYQKLNSEMLFEFRDKLNYKLISEYQKLPSDFILVNKEKISWKDVQLSQTHLSENDLIFLQNTAFNEPFNINYVVLRPLSENTLSKLISDNADKFIDSGVYNDILRVNKDSLSESFLSLYFDKFSYFTLFEKQKVSETFILKHHKVFKQFSSLWQIISHYQNLSESFIIKYRRKLDWFYISRFQNLSETFILKYHKFIDFAGLKGNETINFNKFSVNTLNFIERKYTEIYGEE